jgi:hypothetical protein
MIAGTNVQVDIQVGLCRNLVHFRHFRHFSADSSAGRKCARLSKNVLQQLVHPYLPLTIVFEPRHVVDILQTRRVREEMLDPNWCR